MPRLRSEMRRIREVLRLRAELGANVSAIATGAGLARSTVRAYLRQAPGAGIDGITAPALSDGAREEGGGAERARRPGAPRGREPADAGLGRTRRRAAPAQARDTQAALAGI